MKNFLSICLVLIFALMISACGKKEAPVEEITLIAPIDRLDEMSTQEQIIVISDATTSEAAPAPQARPKAASDKALEPLPEGIMDLVDARYPSELGIQIALRKAGFYRGKVDGKIGLMTDQAVKDFQSANGLKVDGKAGPKTWKALSPYLEQ